jgi:putative PEP-CTERM system TPR-repeat lipoprotein
MAVMVKTLKVLLLLLLITGCNNQSKESLVQDGKAQMTQGNPLGAVVLFSSAIDKDPNYTEARYQLGLAYAKSGKANQAEKELLKVKLQLPDNGAVLLDLAALYISLRRLDDASAELTLFGEKHPKNSRSQEYLGRLRIAQGDIVAADALFTEAIEIDNGNIDARLALAQLYLQQNKLSAARDLLLVATHDFPKVKAAYFMLAALEAHQGHKAEALKAYQQVVIIDAKDIGALYMTGMLALDMGNMTEAQRVAAIMEKSFATHPATARLAGMICYVNADLDNAVVKLKTSLKSMPDFAGYYFLGMAQYRLERYELALNQFQSALDAKPDNLQTRLMVGMTMFKQKRLDDCIRQLDQVLNLDDTIAMAHNVIGSAYLAQGNFDAAMYHIDRAIELNPDLADAHLKKGLFNLSQGNQVTAQIELGKAVEAAPEALNPRILLAAFNLRQHNYTAAIRTLTAGLDGSPQDALLYNYLAAAYMAQKQVDKGLEALEKAKLAKPDYLTPYFNLANYYLANKQRDKTMAEYQAILQVAPNNVKALISLASLQEIGGDAVAAKASYTAAGATQEAAGFLALAGYLARSNDPAGAAQVVESAFQVHPDDPAILQTRGKLLLSQKQYDHAISMFQALDEIKTGAGVPLVVQAWLASGNPDKALAVAENIIKEHPAAVGGYLLQATIYQRLGNVDKAEAVLNKGINLVKNSQLLSLELGTLYARSKREAQAEETFAALRSANPEFVPAIFALGALYDQQGNKRQAVELYKEVLSKAENYTVALNNLAYLYAENYGSAEEALVLAVKAFNNEPSNPGILDTLGLALLKNERYAEAVNVLKKATKLLPKVAVVHLHFGKALLGAGSTADAQKALQTVIDLGASAEADQAQQLLSQMKL